LNRALEANRVLMVCTARFHLQNPLLVILAVVNAISLCGVHHIDMTGRCLVMYFLMCLTMCCPRDFLFVFLSRCFTDRCSNSAATGIAAATARCSRREPTFCLPRCCWACSGWRLRGCCRWPTTPCWRTCSRPGRWPTPKLIRSVG